MSLITAPMTLLEAVNVMLQSIGESKVDELTEDLEEVTVAVDTIREASLEVQSHGWTFNTEDILMELETGTGKIIVPDNTLSIDPVDPYVRVTQRGRYLYDIANNSYVFCNPVRCTLVSCLDYDCLPQHARQFILARAGRRYTERFLGAETYTKFSQQYEFECQRLFKRIEGRHGDYNILTGNNASNRILDRYPRSRRVSSLGR